MSDVVIEGLEEILKRDLLEHEALLDRTKTELAAYQAAHIYEKNKKKHYEQLLANGKFKLGPMTVALKGIDINIRHMKDKMQLSRDKIEHEVLIVNTLKEQLENQNNGLARLAESRRRDALNH